MAFGDGGGDAGHFLEVDDHFVEIVGEQPDLVAAVNVDGLVDISGLANFASHADQMPQRVGDGIRGLIRDQNTG